MTFWACNSTTQNKSETTDKSRSTNKVIGKKFFAYDAIDYYTIDFDESKISDLYDNRSKSEVDSFKLGVILGNIPSSISDLDFIEKLAKIGYKKIQIDKSKYDSIDNVFSEKAVTDYLALSCIKVYRDILIFKKEDKVVGTVKVCFDCWANQIKGTIANTENFGQDGDYDKLKKILLGL